MQHPRGIWFLACLSGLAIVVGCTGTSTSDVPSAETSLVASASPSPAAPVTMGNGAVALEPLETFTMSLPQDLVIASGSVWTTNEAVNTVSRIDTASGKVQAIDLRPGFDPQRLELAAGGIWTTGAGEDGSAGGLARIDPATQKIEYFLRGRFGELAYAFGSLWVAGRGHLVRVDPVTGRAIGATITSTDPGYCLVSAGA
jgi:streptogramin lyase